jgi:outer membrane protein insertion porin family
VTTLALPPFALRVALLALLGLASLAGAASVLLRSSPAAAQPVQTIQRVRDIKVRGNQKVEDEAIKAAIVTRQGGQYTYDRLSDDIKALWKLGFFEDVQVDAEEHNDGTVTLIYIVREKPSVRKIIVGGHDEIGLDKINEVLDLKRGVILNVANVKRNQEKIKDLYNEKGFYLADVTYDIKRVDDTKVDVIYTINERAKVQIRQITFLGNAKVSSDDLRGAMATQEGGYLSFVTSSGTYREDAFQRDLILLSAFYHDRGYINVRMGRPHVVISADKRYLYITIHVEEGPQYRVGKIDVRGDLIEPKHVYRRAVRLKEGDIFNKSMLGMDLMKIQDSFKEKGHAYANITPLTAINAQTRIIDVVFEVEKGPLVYFHRIHIRGNSKTRDKVIRRRLLIAEGDLYSQSKLDLSKKRIMQLGFFEKVDINTKRASRDDRIDVTLELKERPTGTFQVGAGFSSVENFIAQAQVSQNNLFGRGQTLSLQAQVSSIRRLFTLSFFEPNFVDTDFTFAFSVFNRVLYFENFVRSSYGGTLSFGYQLRYDLWTTLTYKVEQVDVQPGGFGGISSGFFGATSNLVGTIPRIANLFRSGLTSSLRGNIRYDTRNDFLFPSRGFYASLGAEVSDSWLGATNVFSRFDLDMRYYRPVIGPVIFKARVEAGYISSRLPEGVPIFERYFLGGISTVRGYFLNSLGPRINVPEQRDPNAFFLSRGFIVGGNLELIGNFELEFPIFERVGIKGVVFVDTGNAFNTEARYCSDQGAGAASGLLRTLPKSNPCTPFAPQNLRISTGFGFRWFSPIGPLRFEWGIPLDRQAFEDPIVFEFTIGNFF